MDARVKSYVRSEMCSIVSSFGKFLFISSSFRPKHCCSLDPGSLPAGSMSFRRFLYMVWDVEAIDGSSSLRRIDTSRFFFRTSTEGIPAPLDSDGGGGAGAADLSAVHDGGRLPDPTINLHSPILPSMVGEVGFLLFKNKGAMGGRGRELDGHDKVVAIDRTGCSFMCDPADDDQARALTMRALPTMTAPKFSPFSLTVGESLYVMDAYPVLTDDGRRHSFEVLSRADHRTFRGIKDWRWRPLDPPPLVEHPNNQYHSIDSYMVDAGGGSNILVSNNASRLTYRFDTVNEAWSKAGDWVLPFSNLAEYLPEHGLWFGISGTEDDYHFCAAAAADPVGVGSSSSVAMEKPPVVRGVWKEYAEPPPEWTPALSYAVHLGSSRFCIVRFFYTGKVYVCPESHRSYTREEDLHVVITGVEVRGRGDGDGDVQVVRHRSERYKVDVRLYYQPL